MSREKRPARTGIKLIEFPSRRRSTLTRREHIDNNRLLAYRRPPSSSSRSTPFVSSSSSSTSTRAVQEAKSVETENASSDLAVAIGILEMTNSFARNMQRLLVLTALIHHDEYIDASDDDPPPSDLTDYDAVLRWEQRHGAVVHPAIDVVAASRVNEFKYTGGDKHELCTICQSEFVKDETVTTLPCAHSFHRDELITWLTTGKNACPTCNTPVVS